MSTGSSFWHCHLGLSMKLKKSLHLKAAFSFCETDMFLYNNKDLMKSVDLIKESEALTRKYRDQFVAEENLVRSLTEKNRREFYDTKKLPAVPNNYRAYLDLPRTSKAAEKTLAQSLVDEVEQKREAFRATGQVPPIPAALADLYQVGRQAWLAILAPDVPGAVFYEYRKHGAPCSSLENCSLAVQQQRCVKADQSLIQRLGLLRSECVLNHEFVRGLVAKLEASSSDKRVQALLPLHVPFAAIVDDMLRDMGLSPSEYQVNVDEFLQLPLSLQAGIFYALAKAGQLIATNEPAHRLGHRLEVANLILRAAIPFHLKIAEIRTALASKTQIPQTWDSDMTLNAVLVQFLGIIAQLSAIFATRHESQERSGGRGGSSVLFLPAPPPISGSTSVALLPEITAVAAKFTGPAAALITVDALGKSPSLRADIMQQLLRVDNSALETAMRIRNNGEELYGQEITILRKYVAGLRSFYASAATAYDARQFAGDFDRYVAYLHQNTLAAMELRTKQAIERGSTFADLFELTATDLVSAIQQELVQDVTFFAAVASGANAVVDSILDSTLGRYLAMLESVGVDSDLLTNLTTIRTDVRTGLLTKKYWYGRISRYHGVSFFSSDLLPGSISIVDKVGNTLTALAQKLRQDEVRILDEIISTKPDLAVFLEPYRDRLQSAGFTDVNIRNAELRFELGAVTIARNSAAVKDALASRKMTYDDKVQIVAAAISSELGRSAAAYNEQILRSGLPQLEIRWADRIGEISRRYADMFVSEKATLFTQDWFLWIGRSINQYADSFLSSSLLKLLNLFPGGAGGVIASAFSALAASFLWLVTRTFFGLFRRA